MTDGRERRNRDRLRSFVLGGVLGASAAIATARRQRRNVPRPLPGGISAFEQAPCFREAVEEPKRRGS